MAGAPLLAVPALAEVAWAFSRVPRSLRARLAGNPVEIDGQRLDPEVQASLSLLGLVGGDGWQSADVAAARRSTEQRCRFVRGRRIRIASTEDLQIDGGDGQLRARLYVPRDAGRGLLVYLHGGGWTVGSLESHDQPCRFLAARSGHRVLAVDYRLAPEHPFPAAPDDALGAFRWAVEHARDLGVDPAAVAIGGDSAGGNLAAVVSNLTVSDAQAPALQVLIYPVCDPKGHYRSHELFGEGFFLTTEERRWYNHNYLGDSPDAEDPRASPLRARDLAGVAPAYVVAAGFDPLRDEAVAYARRLSEAGVPVELRVHRGLIHGFANGVGVGRSAAAATEEVAAAVRAALT